MPAPSTSTLALRGRPESAGRVPAGPAIKSHDESAVITSDEPPTAPRWPRNRRRVSAERERDERVVVMASSRIAAGGEVRQHFIVTYCMLPVPKRMCIEVQTGG